VDHAADHDVLDAELGFEWATEDGSNISGGGQFVTVTPSWIARRAATSLRFDSTAPGYQPGWNADLSISGNGFIEQDYDDLVTGVSYSSASIPPSGTPSIARAHRQHQLAAMRRRMHN
jgi:hypothetical protein